MGHILFAAFEIIVGLGIILTFVCFIVAVVVAIIEAIRRY